MARIILNNGEISDSEIGGSVINEVIGTNGAEQITIKVGGKAVLDASFNRGGDTIHLKGNAASYDVVQSGSAIILTDATGTVTIPVGTAGATIAFADGSRTLVYNTTTNQIQLGSQVVNTTKADVTPGTVSGDVTFTPSAEVVNGATGPLDVLSLTGAAAVRIDFTANTNQITGRDRDGNGIVDNNGVDNVNASTIDDNVKFEIVDAYARNKVNEGDATKNYLGNIYYDGVGFGGDGVNTNGNIFLGGLGADIALGGIGNDFLAGGGVAQGNTGHDRLDGGRNADFFFAELSLLDNTDGNGLVINGGSTTDDSAVGNNTAQDSDWLLLEVGDDEDGTVVDLGGWANGKDGTQGDENLEVVTGAGQVMSGTEIENVDASGNLYGFLDQLAGTDLQLGRGGAANSRGEYQGIGASAQLAIYGSIANNILIGGYDNDLIRGFDGNDTLFGGNLDYSQFNPNSTGIVNDGVDELFGEEGDDNLAWEADGGIYEGDTVLQAAGNGDDTLYLTDQALGAKTGAEITSDGVIRFDLTTGGGSGSVGGLDTSAGYGGADANGRDGNYTADQTNYVAGVVRSTVQDIENVIASGMGAVDYRAAGTNNPDLAFNNQQNHLELTPTVSLDLRGTSGANTLYAAGGNDKLEGREGNDKLSGGNGNDDFIFNLGEISGDGVDVIHRQKDANGDNLWDVTPAEALKILASEGLKAGTPAYETRLNELLYARDFLLNSVVTTGASTLSIDFTDANLDDGAVGPDTNAATNNVYIDSFSVKIGTATFAVTTVNDLKDLREATTAQEVATVVNRVFHAIDSKVTVTTVGNDVVIKDESGRTISAKQVDGYDVSLKVVAPGAGQLEEAVFNKASDIKAQDRLIYTAYEDRTDGEKVNDDTKLGSNISLGRDNYAEDLVISFGADGTRIAEDQLYRIVFTNVTTQDVVTISVNGVQYSLTVGKDLDGNIIAAEDGVGDSQAAIQAAFLSRLADFINSFNDKNTAAGELFVSLVGGDTLTVAQETYVGEETVFMQTPIVTITNGSGGEAAAATVTNESQHEVLLYGFDGRNGELNDTNVLFVGDTGVNRSALQTAKDAGGTITGKDAVLVDNGADTHAATVANKPTTVIVDSQATNAPLDGSEQIYSVHGDDFLIGGKGNDTINGGTGDDRIVGSLGTDTVDGGKNYYSVQVLGEATARVYELNNWEFVNYATPGAVPALAGLVISSITLIDQSEDGTSPDDGRFSDTLQFQQADFNASTRFTIALDGFTTTGADLTGAIQFKNDGAGKVLVDVAGDGATDAGQVTTFTNFENIRTVSGTGKADASQGQGRDTLDLSALSNSIQVGGVAYNLTNNSQDGVGAGQVKYSENAVDVTPATDQRGGEYETAVINVDGVESVIGGLGNDLLYIDENEANKDNSFVGTKGQDRIIYANDYANEADEGDAEATVTIRLDNIAAVTTASTGIDTVSFTKGRNGTTVATDSLTAVERISLEGNTAQGLEEADVLDVTALTAGSTVSFIDGTVVSGGQTHVTIDGIAQIETIQGAVGQTETVVVADASLMATNGRNDTTRGTGPENLLFLSYFDFDTFNTGTLVRSSLSQQAANGQIIQVRNQGEFTYDLGKDATGGADRVDYSAETGDIIVSVGQENATTPQYVIVDGDSNGSLTGNQDRVDILKGVDQIVASKGDSVLDFTGSKEARQITFQHTAVTNPADKSTVEQTIRIADGNGNALTGLNAFVEKYTYNTAVNTADDATWNHIEGGDAAEVIIYQGSEDLVNAAGLDHRFTDDTLNLRGGNNEVRYSGLETSITVNITVTEEDIATKSTSEGLIEATVTFQDGVGGSLTGGGTHEITSYTSDNTIAAGNLKIEGSQDAEDTVFFNSGSDKVYFLGVSPGVIQVNIGNLQAITLTGFEILGDSASDDVYNFADLVSLDGLTLQDSVGDVDTLKLTNSALDNTTINGTAVNFADDTIELDAVETAFGGFDFQVLDISSLTTETDSVITLDAGETVILGDIALFGDNADALVDVNGFETVAFTTTTGMGTSVTVDLDNGEFRNSTGVLFTFGAATTTFDFSALTTAMNVTVVDTANVGATIIGSSAGDTLQGASGNDFFTGGAGADTMDGGFVPVVKEVHTYTLSGTWAPGTADSDVTINGFTITEGQNVQGIVVADGADADQIGAAFVRQWNANPASFTDNALIQSVTYDAVSNALTFTFLDTGANPSDTELGAAVEGAETDANTFAVSAETVTTPYAARQESADTFIYNDPSESTAASMDAITNFSVGAIDDQIDFSALGNTHAGVGNGGAAFANFAAVQTAANAWFDADNVSVYVGGTATDTWVFHSSNTHVADPVIDVVIKLTGIAATGIDNNNFIF